MKLVGGNASARIAGVDELPGKSNYFIGNDPNKWQVNISTYGKIEYRDVYPGVDLIYYGNQRQLEHDFVIAPGADPKAITLAFEGARKISINSGGDLVMDTKEGGVALKRPRVYQTLNGEEQNIAARYALKNGRVSFEVAEYDHRQPLVIDPVLSYSTYLGGNGDDYGHGIAVDSSGNAYVVGQTNSVNFPTATALQAAYGGGYDIFVTKLNATGSALIYSAYLGGSGDDLGFAISVNSSGEAFITGRTDSSDFPTASPLYATYSGGISVQRGLPAYDIFVAKLNAAGSSLEYSTYLGGSGDDVGEGIAVDSSDQAYITGYSYSSNFPTANPFYVAAPCVCGPIVAKLNATGSALLYSTYLGEGLYTSGTAIAVDSSGNAYVTGYSNMGDVFPPANGLYATNRGGSDAFVAKLNASGSGLIYFTYLGGSNDEYGYGIALDSSANAYITGRTNSPDFPTAKALYPAIGGCCGFVDAFVAKLNAAGSALVYSTYLGGSDSDIGQGIALDPAGNAYVVGRTFASDFPTVNALYATYGGVQDGFVAKLDAAGSSLVYSTYLGGSGDDEGAAIAVDAFGNAYVTGGARSADFPTAHALSATYSGGYDAFVAKIVDHSTDNVGPIVSGITDSPNPVAINAGTTLTANVSDSTTGGSNITSAGYNIDGGSFIPMSAVDLGFDQVTESVSAFVAPFSAAGLHTLCVQGTDAAGNVGASECIVLVVYDPTGGFVTGGGAVNSPAGADLTNPNAAGPATFGFNSRYLPGRNTPVGNLEFQFKAGNLNFKSTSMDWLVVTGEPRAIFRGSGTIGGTTVCQFEVDAWDSSFSSSRLDAFGLKIFSCAGGGGRYNLPPTPLKQGNIIIHQ
jgi:hypothetical protein